jgi:hypothetical protein
MNRNQFFALFEAAKKTSIFCARARTQGARFFLAQYTKTGGKHTKLTQNYQMTVKYTKRQL